MLKGLGHNMPYMDTYMYSIFSPQPSKLGINEIFFKQNNSFREYLIHFNLKH